MAKRLGFSDKQIAAFVKSTELAVRKKREDCGKWAFDGFLWNHCLFDYIVYFCVDFLNIVNSDAIHIYQFHRFSVKPTAKVSATVTIIIINVFYYYFSLVPRENALNRAT